MSEAKDADVDRLTVPGTMPTLIADLTCAANGSYTENYIRALCERAAEALQSLSQEAVREEVLEEAARECGICASRQVTKHDQKVRDQTRRDIASAIRALKREPNTAGQLGQGRYSAPFKMVGGKEEWVQIRFVSRDHIHDKPTEANPSPIRVILMHELERAQPAAMARPAPGASDA